MKKANNRPPKYSDFSDEELVTRLNNLYRLTFVDNVTDYKNFLIMDGCSRELHKRGFVTKVDSDDTVKVTRR